ncbi:YfhO family protein [uncultured Tenacibaculum sp.]|uniref:YfhO family protein n=1 Tax=uncultured Tenacibaculum sp. TaxID=174713 RepID=UPI00262F7F8A|nr:YfhO family protein [uncultured Tenacibaculum sp.]
MKFTKYLPHLGAIVLFMIAALLYFNPVLGGKQIKQSDITQYIGMAKEMNDFRAKENAEPYWIGNAFSGMPSYQVGAKFPNDLIKQIDYALRFLPRPADYLFLYFLGFFLLLNALKVDWKLAILGSLSFGFSTYLIIIFGAGHNAKAHAIAYMPVVVAGVLYVFQKRYLLGFIVTALGMALEIVANHIQMTYYLGFCLLILGIVEAIDAFKKKQLPEFSKQVGILLIAFIIGIGTNATRLLSTKEYANYSTRGKSELTINPDGTPKEKTKGLDKAYITEYSYGILETFNLIVPRYMGGGTVEKLDESSNFYQVIEESAGKKVAKDYSEQVLTYWGTQPIVEAPAYIGAVIWFLFFLGVFFVRGKLKYWLVSATIFSLLLSWGKNFSILTDLFIDYVPLYNKFRAVSSIQVIAELCVPLLGILGLKEFFSSKISKEEKEQLLIKALAVTGGIIVLGLVLALMSSTFEGIRDGQYKQLPSLIDALIADRKSMLYSDTFRSLLLVALSGGALWFFIKEKVKLIPVLGITAVLILFDLLSTDLRYVNEEDFTSARNVQRPFTANEADKKILRDKSHYRVANFAANITNEGRTSYFHNSIGGYHAAKMMRYQELFEYQIAKNNFEILNMLNTKYLIGSETEVQLNDKANGNAWFISSLQEVDSANDEMKALDKINTKEVAVIRKQDYSGTTSFKTDSLSTISLTTYKPNHLTYKSNTKNDQFAVFSEIFYKDGWNAYVDGKLMPHYQVNYVLRGMNIPAGEHKIEFKFEPQVIKTGGKIAMLFYVLLIVIPLGWYFFERKKTTPLDS